MWLAKKVNLKLLVSFENVSFMLTLNLVLALILLTSEYFVRWKIAQPKWNSLKLNGKGCFKGLAETKKGSMIKWPNQTLDQKMKR